MHLLIVRHARALDREEFAATERDDAERPLTEAGRADMRRAARGISRQLEHRPDLLVSSPYTRAVETAGILSTALGRPEARRIDSLIPTSAPGEFVDWLAAQAGRRLVVAVGHEPHLGLLLSWVLAAHRMSFIELKKGGAALVEFAGSPAPGNAQLRWVLTPRQLRDLR